MRVYLRRVYSNNQFLDLLLKQENGGYLEKYGMMSISYELCTIVTTVQELKEKMYPDVIHSHDKQMEWFCERAILAPK